MTWKRVVDKIGDRTRGANRWTSLRLHLGAVRFISCKATNFSPKWSWSPLKSLTSSVKCSPSIGAGIGGTELPGSEQELYTPQERRVRNSAAPVVFPRQDK
ncbi:hypothetical protein CLOP_g9563 [Closterium sp. NIES-67]|nr:hypothetical protein CLOP_g9563 [Closterium sp. NIES-67]